MTLHEVASKLHKAKPRAIKNAVAGYVACCPAHDDKSPSFAVWEGHDEWLHFKCQAGCTEAQILSALGMKPDDRKCNRDGRQSNSVTETVYIYTDENGGYLFEKVRGKKPTGEKAFFQRIKCADGSFQNSLCSLNGQARMLYRIAEVKAAIRAGQPVFINEGEKAVEAFRRRGFVATCQPSGAGKPTDTQPKWLPWHSESLRGAIVVIVADRDGVGEAYAALVARSLKGIAKSVRVVQSKTTNEHDDAYDHFLAEFEVEDFVRRVDLEPPRGIRRTNLATVTEQPVHWLWENRIPIGACTGLSGEGDIGKTYAMAAIIAAITRGATIKSINLHITEPRKVLIFAMEDSASKTLVPRIKQFGGDLSMVEHIDDHFVFDAEGLERVEETVLDENALMAVIDPLSNYYPRGFNPNNQQDVRPMITAVSKVADKTNAAFILMGHVSKAAQEVSPKYRGMGSVDFSNACRSGFLIEKHPEEPGQVCIIHTKHNWSPVGATPTILYELSPERGFMWIGECDLTADQFSKQKAARGRPPTARDRAVIWLKEILESGPKGVGMIRKWAEEEDPKIAARALYRAKEFLELIETMSDGKKIWTLPYGDAATTTASPSNNSGGQWWAKDDDGEYDPWKDE